MDAVAWISAVLKIVFVVLIILTFAPVLIWAERRQSAMIHDRIGPTRAGVKRATLSKSKPAKARRKASRLRKMVSHDSPD